MEWHAAKGLDRGCVVAGWTPVQAPFWSLRGGLAEAERRLNGKPADGSPERWQRLREAVGNEQACLDAVNDLLAAVLAGWQLAGLEDEHRRVLLVPTAGTDPAELTATQALALLIEAGGWSRLGRCARTGCTGVFLDITSGGNPRACRAPDRNR